MGDRPPPVLICPVTRTVKRRRVNSLDRKERIGIQERTAQIRVHVRAKLAGGH